MAELDKFTYKFGQTMVGFAERIAFYCIKNSTEEENVDNHTTNKIF